MSKQLNSMIEQKSLQLVFFAIILMVVVLIAQPACATGGADAASALYKTNNAKDESDGKTSVGSAADYLGKGIPYGSGKSTEKCSDAYTCKQAQAIKECDDQGTCREVQDN